MMVTVMELWLKVRADLTAANVEFTLYYLTYLTFFNWTIWPSELNQNRFFRVTYNTWRDQRVPLSVFLALWDFFFWQKNSPKGPYSFFWCLATHWMLRNPKECPLSVFSALWDFFPKGSRWARQFAPTFGFFRYCTRILDSLKSFCYFWALDMAPTYAGLFKLYCRFWGV